MWLICKHPRSLICAFVVRCLDDIIYNITYIIAKSKISRLAGLCSWAGRFEFYLVAYTQDRFSHDVAQIHSHVTAASICLWKCCFVLCPLFSAFRLPCFGESGGGGGEQVLSLTFVKHSGVYCVRYSAFWLPCLGEKTSINLLSIIWRVRTLNILVSYMCRGIVKVLVIVVFLYF